MNWLLCITVRFHYIKQFTCCVYLCMFNDGVVFYLAARTEWGMTETQVGSLHDTVTAE